MTISLSFVFLLLKSPKVDLFFFFARVSLYINRGILMLKNNQNSGGFTLIEVLVVVLIIGILTSVALPQYQRSVTKARFAQAKIAANALAQAEEVYYATHMEYTPVLDNLDVSIDVTSYPTSCSSESSDCSYGTSWGRCRLIKNGRVYCYILEGILFYAIFFEENTYRTGQKICFASKIGDHYPTASDWTYKFCQQETGSLTPEGAWGAQKGFLYSK